MLYTYGKVIITTEPIYEQRTDVYQIDYNSLMASIGDQLGVFLGMSFPAFIQLVVWSVMALIKAYTRPKNGQVKVDNS